MTESLFIRVRGKVQGPFDAEKLRQLARRGQFSRMHEVSPDGQVWLPARDRPDLFAAAAEPRQEASAATTPGASGDSVAASAGLSSIAASRPPSAAVAQPATMWYVVVNGQEQGPFDAPGVRDLFATRRLPPSTEVWSQGMAEWAAASSIPGLLPAAADPAWEPDTKSQNRRSSQPEVSSAVIDALGASRGWVVFITVMTFIYAGLMFLGGIAQIAQGARLQLSPMTGLGLLNILLAGCVTMGAFLLLAYTSGIAAVERSRTASALAAALAALKRFWVYVGVLLIVALALAILFLIVVASVATSLPADFSGR